MFHEKNVAGESAELIAFGSRKIATKTHARQYVVSGLGSRPDGLPEKTSIQNLKRQQ
jgi:hypothetical protein